MRSGVVVVFVIFGVSTTQAAATYHERHSHGNGNDGMVVFFHVVGEIERVVVRCAMCLRRCRIDAWLAAANMTFALRRRHVASALKWATAWFIGGFRGVEELAAILAGARVEGGVALPCGGA